MTNPDFVAHFENGSSTVWRIEAQSEEAIAFAEERFVVEPWQGTPVSFWTDHRAANALCCRLEHDGFVVAFGNSH